MRETIRTRGPQSFGWFMQEALYHPGHGYYSSGRAILGRRGDYFTNVSVGPVFGRLMATQFIEIWERMDRVDDFTIVEQGAHDGWFAHDVLQAICELSPRLFETIRYCILEPLPLLQQRQQTNTHQFADKIAWQASLKRSFAGVHFSNELLDAIPTNLRGKSVGLNGDKFVFVKTPDDSCANAAQLKWVDDLAANLQRGFIIAIDYGFVRSQFHDVVQARAQHQLLASPFEKVGDADITVHINWTDLAKRAEECGLQIAGFTDQHHFLTGLLEWMAIRSQSPNHSTALIDPAAARAFDAKELRQLQTLLHPEMLGRAFQVLALAKNLELREPLAGYRFGSDPRATLELK